MRCACMRPSVIERSPSVMNSVPSRPNTSRPPKCSGEASDGAWWKITCTFSTFGAAPSTNRPRATAVLFTPPSRGSA